MNKTNLLWKSWLQWNCSRTIWILEITPGIGKVPRTSKGIFEWEVWIHEVPDRWIFPRTSWRKSLPSWHKDKARSIYTVIFYLTDEFQGGETNFLENNPNTDRFLYTDDATGDFIPGTKRVFASVKPKKGSCLLFYQRGILHQAADISLPSSRGNEGSDQQDAVIDVSRSTSISAAHHQAFKIIL